MSNEKHYPLHPNATHPPVMTCEIPLEEYESLKRENAELNAKVDELSFDKKLLEDHWESEKIRCEAASRDCIELSNENAKLVSKIESLKVGHRQGIANIKSYYKAKLESVQATAYAESVDAGMENRRLKRALWFSRAKAYRYIAELLSCFNPDFIRNRRMFIPNNSKQKQMNSLELARLMLNVERKCRAKSEQYK